MGQQWNRVLTAFRPVSRCWQVLLALLRTHVRARIGPLSQGCLDEPLRIAIGSWRVRLGVEVFNPQTSARAVDRLRGVKRAFLWMFIRGSFEAEGLATVSFIDQPQMNNLLTNHS